jgi:nucleoside-diphosphate-sugar epimerase|tara:strand:+ start:460 stop:1437 length:978 start_codon:yes stop_codon:yes gene_type:complete
MAKLLKKALVLGGGGFIGSHLVKKLKNEGYWVRAVDLKYPEYWQTEADDFIQGDLKEKEICNEALNDQFDEVYQLAADMGGAGFIFTGENDADIMHNSCMINLNILEASRTQKSKNIFYSGSACMYPEHNQIDPENPNCSEASAYPANPDSEYGWEKLFSERLYLAYQRNYGFNSHIARYHNIFGPYGTWDGGREKAPAAICRKVSLCNSNDQIEIWGDGEQTRSFLYIDECLEGTTRLTRSNLSGPFNIGSEEMVTINELVDIVADIAGKKIMKSHIDGPLGVRGRNSDNKLIHEKLKWKPSQPLIKGLELTYGWIDSQVKANR